MERALPHILAAERQLEMLRYYVTNKDRLSLDARVPMCFNRVIHSLSALQRMFYDEEEFQELYAATIAEVSKDREYNLFYTKDNDGNMYFDTHALLPLEKVQEHMLLTGGVNEATISISDKEFDRDEKVS